MATSHFLSNIQYTQTHTSTSHSLRSCTNSIEFYSFNGLTIKNCYEERKKRNKTEQSKEKGNVTNSHFELVIQFNSIQTHKI